MSDGSTTTTATSQLDDLDMRRFELEYPSSATSPEALAENGRTLDQQLRALRLVDSGGTGGTPAVTAILTLGGDPRQWLPGADIQFRRLNGTALTDDIVDHRVVSGTLSDQIRQIEELVGLNIARRASVGGALRIETPDYSEEAARQLIRNALIHRSYEERPHRCASPGSRTESRSRIRVAPTAW